MMPNIAAKEINKASNSRHGWPPKIVRSSQKLIAISNTGIMIAPANPNTHHFRSFILKGESDERSP